MRLINPLLKTAASPAVLTPQQSPVPQLTSAQIDAMVNEAAEETYKEPKFLNPTETPQFKKWFGNSVVTNSDGSPKVVYHGSTHDFEQFSMENGNPENHYGKGFYFTDSKIDVSSNYGTQKGPDLTSRINNRAEQIMDNIRDAEGESLRWGTPEYKEAYAKAKAKAKEEIAGNTGGLVYLTYLRILKPVVVSERGGTWFEVRYNERTGEESGSGMRLYRALMKAASEFDADGDAIWGKAVELGDLYGEFNAYQFEKGIRGENYHAMDLQEGTQSASAGALIARAYQLCGFDGIVQKGVESQFRGMNLSQGTTHYIVWNPRQIKSAIGNNGNFNPRSPKMTASKEASWAGAVDFSEDPEWYDLFYGKPTPERVKELARFLRNDPNRFITLYHGTDANLPIMQKGLLPTSATRRRSLQSSPGYVYLSVFPGSAEDFGRMGNPGKPIQVYKVEVTVRRLLPDADQLGNKRLWGGDEYNQLGNSLAESLVYGHGARVKGKVDPYQLIPTKEFKQPVKE